MTRYSSGAVDDDFVIQQALNTIQSTYGAVVSVDAKAKGLTKFGRNDNIGTTEETVWLQGGTEEEVTGNGITKVVSTNAGDDQEIVVEGHTISGSDLTFVIQTVTLDGTTEVALDTPLHTVTRFYNNGSTDFTGTITVEEADDTVHLKTSGANNQSLKAATSVSSVDYWVVTGLTCSVNRQNSRSVDFKLQVRLSGKVWRTIFPISVHSTGGTVHVPFVPAIIIPPNSDVRLRAISSGTTTGVEGAIHGVLAT